MLPVIALVGRANVGKSTLFNRITKTRDAIVADFAGLTRDRHYGRGRHNQHEFVVVDTGGFEPDSDSAMYQAMAKQTQQAIAEADVCVFLVDARAGVTGPDFEIAKYLRKSAQKTVLAINKSEGLTEGGKLSEFYELGLGEVAAVSAAHGQGVKALLDLVYATALAEFANPPEEDPSDTLPDRPHTIKLAVAGRPNVGKSTLINTWLGEERLVAFDQPGTTRDAITVPFERGGVPYELIDTAGLRKKGKVFEAIEKFSVIKTLQAIDNANVVLLLSDATQGVSDQDAHIAGYILESGRAVVIAINKWDAVDSYQREQTMRSIEQRLAFLKFANIHNISARKRQGLAPVWKSIEQAHRAAFIKLPTPKLTRLILDAVQAQSPKRAGMFRPKLRYAHQGGINPPIVVVHGNSLEHVQDSYKRYLEGQIRKAFDVHGTPLRVEMRTSDNPFSK